MPNYDFRLESQDGSGHYREGTISITDIDMENTGAETPEAAARAILEERERDFAAFALAPEHEAELQAEYGVGSDELPHAAPLDASEEEKADFRGLKVQHRAWLNLHRQEQPYKLKSLKEVTD
jgi:hypothetical protein